ncbi:MAG: hypothetical protein V1742_04690 [Pseudomonadota bacterium]
MKTIILAVICFLGAVSFSQADKLLYPYEVRDSLRSVPPKEIVQVLSMGHTGFLSDLFFAQVNVHSGSLTWRPGKLTFDSQWAYGMMELITELDPKYYMAYLFCGMGLIHDFDDIKLAAPIMKKGMAVFPDSWEIPFWLGNGYYLYAEDYKEASHYLWQAANKPGAPKYFLAFMTKITQRAGDYDRAIWAMKAMLEDAKDENLKVIYTKRIIQLENMSGLNQAARFFKEKKGGWPNDLQELVKEGIIKAVPQDPFGLTYKWDRQSNRVSVIKGNRAVNPPNF